MKCWPWRTSSQPLTTLNLTHTHPPPPQPHPTYQSHSSIWQNNAPQPSYISKTIVDILNQSILQQAQTSKEHFLNNAKTCDGTYTKDFESWLEEIDRLSDVTGKTNIAVATFTARVHYTIKSKNSKTTNMNGMLLNKIFWKGFQSLAVPSWQNINNTN